MNIREMAENREEEFLSEYASLSRNTRGRDREEAQCDIRPVYQRDRDRILHCKSFRRLKHKTQVFLNPQGDHYRDRLTHTLEVSQIARTIAQALPMALVNVRMHAQRASKQEKPVDPTGGLFPYSFYLPKRIRFFSLSEM